MQKFIVSFAIESCDRRTEDNIIAKTPCDVDWLEKSGHKNHSSFYSISLDFQRDLKPICLLTFQ